MFGIRQILALLVFGAAVASPAGAQNLSLADLQGEILGIPWLCTVEGEKRARTMVLSSLAQKADGIFEMVGTYNFPDASPSPIKAGEIRAEAGNLVMTFTTGAGSAVSASAQPDGSFAGTIKYANGQSKPMKLEKDAAAAVAKLSNLLTADEIRKLVSGKIVDMGADATGLVTQYVLEAGGDGVATTRTSRNTSTGPLKWLVNEKGELCTHIQKPGYNQYCYRVQKQEGNSYGAVRGGRVARTFTVR